MSHSPKIEGQYIEDGIVQLNERVSDDTLEMLLHSPKIAKATEPGQFVMLSCTKSGTSSNSSSMLRRPFSVHDVRGDTISILYKVVGTGTQLMTDIDVDDRVSILGPLGQGFKVADTKHHCLVGGGIGIAPLLHLAKIIKQADQQAKITILEGARNQSELLVLDKFDDLGEMLVSTDDGSQGHHGFVTELLNNITIEDTTVYCCGPIPMMKAVAAIAKQKSWKCQVAMETHMACGMGACLGCSYLRAGDHQGVEKYIHVCKDGPVLDSEVLW